MWALKEKFNQWERNCNNQDNMFTNDNNQSNNQSNQNSEQNQHSAVSHDRNCERYNQFFNQFLNNWFNNISSITDEKQLNQNIKKFMMTRVFSTAKFEKSTEFAKILNQTAQSINKSIK